MKTAIEQAIQSFEMQLGFVKIMEPHQAIVGVLEAQIESLKQLLPVEREQIEQAYNEGMQDLDGSLGFESYFDKTFKN